MPVITFRHPEPGNIRARAEALGLSRSAYLARLVDQDLARPLPARKGIDVSDLCGSAPGGHGSDNPSIRRRMQTRR